MKKCVIYSLAFCLLLPVAANAQISNQMSVGARPIGLGGAFSAVANDGNAIFWNPAGLSLIKQNEVSFMYNKWFMDMSYSFFGITLPVSSKYTISLGINSLNAGEIEAKDINNMDLGTESAEAMLITLGNSLKLSDKFY
ncbi:hypothetical protein IIB79_03385, partial [candidate division KSB1 bacterium]|nr:hypothetical protein [candidate division KSB1 bacterium]